MTISVRTQHKAIISAVNDTVASESQQSLTGKHTIDLDKSWESGTGAGQVDIAYRQKISLINGVTQFQLQDDSADLGSGAGKQLDGESKSVATLYGFYIENRESGNIPFTMTPSASDSCDAIQDDPSDVMHIESLFAWESEDGKAITTNTQNIDFVCTQAQDIWVTVIGKST